MYRRDFCSEQEMKYKTNLGFEFPSVIWIQFGRSLENI